jgi:hypothetical protein
MAFEMTFKGGTNGPLQSNYLLTTCITVIKSNMYTESGFANSTLQETYQYNNNSGILMLYFKTCRGNVYKEIRKYNI